MVGLSSQHCQSNSICTIILYREVSRLSHTQVFLLNFKMKDIESMCHVFKKKLQESSFKEREGEGKKQRKTERQRKTKKDKERQKERKAYVPDLSCLLLESKSRNKSTQGMPRWSYSMDKGKDSFISLTFLLSDLKLFSLTFTWIEFMLSVT